MINKTSANQTSQINLAGAAAVTRVTADVASGASMSDWTMLFNGVADPSNDLGNAPSTVRTIAATNSVVWTFPLNSMTLLRLG